MPAWALLLRGINVGTAKRIAMADLREALAGLGFERPRTLLMSGNAVFTAPAQPAPALERRLQTAIEGRFGIEVECLVRTAKEWSALRAANPFPAEAKRDPGHLVMVVLRSPPGARAVAALRAAIRGPERIEVVGRELWVVYSAGIGTSRLTLPVIEKHLGTRGTGRNWNTVGRIAAMLAE